MKQLIVTGILSLAILVGAHGFAEDLGPSELIDQCAQKMLKALNANRAAYRKDPTKIHALVDEVLLPHFDTEYSARMVLGTHWRTATAEQRRAFIDAFYQSLLENYGAALAEFTGDRMKVLPFRGDLATGKATVRTEVKRNDGTRVPVNYTLRKTEQGWKAWDVSIEGISYVKNFKTQFGSEIDQKGLDAVIKRLETEGVKPIRKTA
jgi:phospholipid transport system substrate-binding protein